MSTITATDVFDGRDAVDGLIGFGFNIGESDPSVVLVPRRHVELAGLNPSRRRPGMDRPRPGVRVQHRSRRGGTADSRDAALRGRRARPGEYRSRPTWPICFRACCS